MKRVAFTAMVALICLATSGQKIGIRAGVSFANANMDVMSLNVSPDVRTGVHFGIVGELLVWDFLYFQPALLFSQKGYEFDMDIEGERFKGSEHFNYLDLPLNILFKADLNGPKLLLLTGPTISYALNGKYDYEIAGSWNEFDRGDLEFGSGDEEYDKAAFGWNVGTGFEVGALQLTGTYTFGLSNITHSNDIEIKHKVLGISLTYLIGK